MLESLNLVISKPETRKTTENVIQVDGGSPLDGVDDPEERKDLKTSLKLFLPSFKPEAIHEALQSGTRLYNQPAKLENLAIRLQKLMEMKFNLKCLAVIII